MKITIEIHSPTDAVEAASALSAFMGAIKNGVNAENARTETECVRENIESPEKLSKKEAVEKALENGSSHVTFTDDPSDEKNAEETPKQKRARIKEELKFLGDNCDASKTATAGLEKRLAKLQAEVGGPGEKPTKEEKETPTKADSVKTYNIVGVRTLCKAYAKDISKEKLYEVLEKHGKSRQLSVVEKDGFLQIVASVIDAHLTYKRFGEAKGGERALDLLKLIGNIDKLSDLPANLHSALRRACEEKLGE